MSAQPAFMGALTDGEILFTMLVHISTELISSQSGVDTAALLTRDDLAWNQTTA